MLEFLRCVDINRDLVIIHELCRHPSEGQCERRQNYFTEKEPFSSGLGLAISLSLSLSDPKVNHGLIALPSYYIFSNEKMTAGNTFK